VFKRRPLHEFELEENTRADDKSWQCVLYWAQPNRFLINSFILDIYIAPLQETYSEALTVQLRPKLRSKRNVLIKKLAERRHIARGNKRSVTGSSFQVERPIAEKARHCFRHCLSPDNASQRDAMSALPSGW